MSETVFQPKGTTLASLKLPFGVLMMKRQLSAGFFFAVLAFFVTDQTRADGDSNEKQRAEQLKQFIEKIAPGVYDRSKIDDFKKDHPDLKLSSLSSPLDDYRAYTLEENNKFWGISVQKDRVVRSMLSQGSNKLEIHEKSFEELVKALGDPGDNKKTKKEAGRTIITCEWKLKLKDFDLIVFFYYNYGPSAVDYRNTIAGSTITVFRVKPEKP